LGLAAGGKETPTVRLPDGQPRSQWAARGTVLTATRITHIIRQFPDEEAEPSYQKPNWPTGYCRRPLPLPRRAAAAPGGCCRLARMEQDDTGLDQLMAHPLASPRLPRGAEPACRGPRPRGRRHPTDTSAHRQSGPRSRPNAIGRLAEGAASPAVWQLSDRTSAPGAASFDRRCRARARRADSVRLGNSGGAETSEFLRYRTPFNILGTSFSARGTQPVPAVNRGAIGEKSGLYLWQRARERRFSGELIHINSAQRKPIILPMS
jgi:hypothetical protein